MAGAVVLAALVRAPFWDVARRTAVDGDTGLVGLMARHLGEGTTLWGQPYGSPLDAWLAAPAVLLLGPTRLAARLSYFALSLVLVPLAAALARRAHPEAGPAAAMLMACPPAYAVLLAAARLLGCEAYWIQRTRTVHFDLVGVYLERALVICGVDPVLPPARSTATGATPARA